MEQLYKIQLAIIKSLNAIDIIDNIKRKIFFYGNFIEKIFYSPDNNFTETNIDFTYCIDISQLEIPELENKLIQQYFFKKYYLRKREYFIQ